MKLTLDSRYRGFGILVGLLAMGTAWAKPLDPIDGSGSPPSNSSSILIHSLSQTGKTSQTMPNSEPLYQEKYRPLFHFTAKKNWLNDPNGLVYYKGQYHLFFQYDPTGLRGDHKSWGHAVSPDLVHWTELPVAINFDDRGDIWSGSATLDFNNSSGLGTKANPPLVAFYTLAKNPFAQDLAYSTDSGTTWERYSGNPVIAHIADENRDPRVVWDAEHKEWVLVIYVTGNDFQFFTSTDLTHWTKAFKFTLAGSAECPEFFPIQVKGSSVTKWVFYSADYHYVIGDWDGQTFTPEIGPIKGDLDFPFYASQTYSNAPHGRRIQIAWMRGGDPYPGMPFTQQMSFPCDLSLIDTDDGLRLARLPVPEIEKLYTTSTKVKNFTVIPGKVETVVTGGSHLDISATVKWKEGTVATLKIGDTEIKLDFGDPDGEISVNGSSSGVVGDPKEIPIRILIDTDSAEVYLQNGLLVSTRYRNPDGLPDHLTVSVESGELSVSSLQIHRLKSAWPVN